MKTSLSRFVVAATFALAVSSASLMAGDGWLTDYRKAVAESQKTNRPILVEFTGSDWCPPCKMLEEMVLSKDEFKKYAEENLVLLKLDYPQFKEQSEEVRNQNAALAERFGVQGFPTLMLLDENENELARAVGLQTTEPKGLVEWIETAEGA